MTMNDSTTNGLPVIEMPAGLPGFPTAHQFVLEPWGDGDSPFALLISLDFEALEFLVGVAGVVVPDYAPEIEDAYASALGLTCAEDALVLVMVTIPDSPADATVNLLAPVIINIRTNIAAQVVLDSDSLEDLRRPLWASPVPA